MKLANLIMGTMVFSIVITLLFTAVKDMTKTYDSRDKDDYDDLAGKYGFFVGEISTNTDSTLRNIDNATKQGEASSETRDIRILSGGLNAVRLITGFVPIFGKLISKAQGDTGFLVPQIIFDVIIAMIIVFLVIIVIHMIMRSKTET